MEYIRFLYRQYCPKWLWQLLNISYDSFRWHGRNLCLPQAVCNSILHDLQQHLLSNWERSLQSANPSYTSLGKEKRWGAVFRIGHVNFVMLLLLGQLMPQHLQSSCAWGQARVLRQCPLPSRTSSSISGASRGLRRQLKLPSLLVAAIPMLRHPFFPMWSLRFKHLS